MKTQNRTLNFEKLSVIELQIKDLAMVNGGTITIQPSITVTIADLTQQITRGGGEDSSVTRQ